MVEQNDNSPEENLEDSLLEALARIDEFREAYDKIPMPKNGAAQAAEIILGLA